MMREIRKISLRQHCDPENINWDLFNRIMRCKMIYNYDLESQNVYLLCVLFCHILLS